MNNSRCQNWCRSENRARYFNVCTTNLTKRLTISQNVTLKSFCEISQNYREFQKKQRIWSEQQNNWISRENVSLLLCVGIPWPGGLKQPGAHLCRKVSLYEKTALCCVQASSVQVTPHHAIIKTAQPWEKNTLPAILPARLQHLNPRLDYYLHHHHAAYKQFIMLKGFNYVCSLTNTSNLYFLF